MASHWALECNGLITVVSMAPHVRLGDNIDGLDTIRTYLTRSYEEGHPRCNCRICIAYSSEVGLGIPLTARRYDAWNARVRVSVAPKRFNSCICSFAAQR
jgi:hypothetical protein